MRNLVGILGGLGVLCVLLLLLSGLVQGPEVLENPAAAEMPEPAALLAAAQQIVPERTAEGERPEEPQRALPARMDAGRVEAPVSRDRNGRPLGSRPWHSAVWVVNPPEAAFG